MSGTLYRAQVLLETEQQAQIAELAHRQGRSFSDLLREIVQKYLDEQAEHSRERQSAFEQLKAHRAEILAARNGQALDLDVQKLIDEMRQERDDELSSNLSAGH
jgi:predicted CopG family antitoxin